MRLAIIPSGDHAGVARFDDLVVTVSRGTGGYEVLVEAEGLDRVVQVDIGNATGDKVVWDL